MKILAAGPRALLLELERPDQVLGLYREIERRRGLGWAPELIDVVPAAQTVLLDGVEDQEGLAAELLSWPPPEPVRADGETLEVPTVYDGADLEAVAELWQMTVAKVVRMHQALPFSVAFCGFSPGFAYLAGLPPELAVPRRASPRPAVPAGSVALAGEYSGIYPRSSPGGWQLIGRTDLILWDPRQDPPALLTPGMRVRFVTASRSG